MTVIDATTAPTFELEGVVFTGLAAPSRGSSENAVWRFRLDSTQPGAPHELDREEIIVALAGRAVVTLDGEDHDVAPGDAIVIPPGTRVALRCAEAGSGDGAGDGFEGVAVLPVGGQGCFPGGEPFVPPWAR